MMEIPATPCMGKVSEILAGAYGFAIDLIPPEMFGGIYWYCHIGHPPEDIALMIHADYEIIQALGELKGQNIKPTLDQIQAIRGEIMKGRAFKDAVKEVFPDFRTNRPQP